MTQKYILVDKKPKRCNDLMEWARWFEKGDEARRVAHDVVNGVSVSTVFLGLDHQYGGGPPLLFETMEFGQQDMERYSTWEEAEAGHRAMVERVKARHAKSPLPENSDQ